MNDWRARGNLSFEFKTVNESQFLPFLKSLFWREIAEKVQDVFMKANIQLWRNRWKLSQQPRSPGSALFLNRRLSYSLIHERTVFFCIAGLHRRRKELPAFGISILKGWSIKENCGKSDKEAFRQFRFRQKAKAQSNKLVSSKQKSAFLRGWILKLRNRIKKEIEASSGSLLDQAVFNG